MCELLGMSANVPTDICFSFTGLVQRGGGTGPHKDGWGITFYEGKGCRTFKDPQPSFQSPIARLVQEYPIKSCSVVAHIRQANRGEVSLENTHPFTRELWGRNWTYAHNGQLKGYKGLDTGPYRPIGDWPAVFRYIAELASELRQKGVFNMLLSDGRYLMAFCSTNLFWITRRAPFGKAKLLDQDVEIDFQKQTTPNDVVTVIATQPLTANESWNKIEPGDWALFCLGERQS